ncbi:nucleophosmin 1b isoform X2 [Lepisosteus oculatus]|uniref:nucleophosmin 1b isoform X2 n=1 Tax=Lepisosteus oculatus TaxID=7918 RepID=UPI0035F52609
MAEGSDTEFGRPQIYLFGCELKSDKKEYKVKIEEDEAEHQLSLKAVCLGAEAEDVLHTVEVEGMTYDGKIAQTPLAVLKPSVLPTVSLGGFEITPPATFRLKTGSGPVFISGQHFVSMKESEDENEDEEEENNTSPVKRPSSLTMGFHNVKKKLKMETEEEEDDEDEDDDEDDDDEEEEEETPVKTPQKNSAIKTTQKNVKGSPEKAQAQPKSASKQNGSSGKKGLPPAKPQTKSPGGNKETSPGNVQDIKAKLSTLYVEKKMSLPKTEQKFENYARSSLKITDKEVIKELWEFVQTFKTGGK